MTAAPDAFPLEDERLEFLALGLNDYTTLEHVRLSSVRGDSTRCAVLAEGTPAAWEYLWRDFADDHVPDNIVPSASHHLLAYFARDVKTLECEDLFASLSAAREALEPSNTVACVFLVEPLRRELEEAYGSPLLEEVLATSGLAQVADKYGVCIFHDLTSWHRQKFFHEHPDLTMDLKRFYLQQDYYDEVEKLKTANDALAASEAKASTLATDLTAKNVAIAELAKATNDPALRVKLEVILSAGTTSGAE